MVDALCPPRAASPPVLLRVPYRRLVVVLTLEEAAGLVAGDTPDATAARRGLAKIRTALEGRV